MIGASEWALQNAVGRIAVLNGHLRDVLLDDASVEGFALCNAEVVCRSLRGARHHLEAAASEEQTLEQLRATAARADHILWRLQRSLGDRHMRMALAVPEPQEEEAFVVPHPEEMSTSDSSES